MISSKKSKARQLNHQKIYFNKVFLNQLYSTYKLLPWQERYIKHINKYLFRRSGSKKGTLVDIGEGSGYISIEMAKLGFDVYATDISRSAIVNLNKVKKKFGLNKLNVLLSDAEKIPLRDSSADYLVANAILEHCHNEDKTIKEWMRVLKPKGRLFIVVPLKYKYILPTFWPITYIYDKKLGHLRRYDLASLKRKFGLKVIKVIYSGHTLKMVWFFISRFYKSRTIDEWIEERDSRLDSNSYGAVNITAIFEKP